MTTHVAAWPRESEPEGAEGSILYEGSPGMVNRASMSEGGGSPAKGYKDQERYRKHLHSGELRDRQPHTEYWNCGGRAQQRVSKHSQVRQVPT